MRPSDTFSAAAAYIGLLGESGQRYVLLPREFVKRKMNH
jgi:hypothetical protein